MRRLCRHDEIKEYLTVDATALHLAIEKNRWNCVEALKETAGGTMNWKQPGNGGRTPVAEAAARGFAEILEVLLSVVPGSRLNLNNVELGKLYKTVLGLRLWLSHLPGTNLTMFEERQ